jgi:signal peptidase II
MLKEKVNNAIMPKINNEKIPNKSALLWLWLSLLVVVLDQITKIWIDSSLNYNQPVTVLPFFDLRLLYNQGAAWSFLATAGGWQRWFLTSLAIVVSIILVVWLSRLKQPYSLLAVAIALILGGAVGNVIDRIIYGYVIDFIDIYYNAWHWPAFNLADSAISLGAIILIIDALRGQPE